MAKKSKHSGFSLTEVLMAVGILAIGMMLIATMFPVGIYLTTVATERTMAAIVADEAFAKIQLYGFENPSNPIDYSLIFDYESAHNDPLIRPLFTDINEIDTNEFSYPSVDPAMKTSQYYWSALCKKLDANSTSNDTQYLVTIFIARKTNPNLTYDAGYFDRPRVVDANVQKVPGEPNNTLKVLSGEAKYVNPPTTILVLDNDNNIPGRLYCVVDRINNADANFITLDRDLDPDSNNPNAIRFIPPPDSGGKNADVGVFPPRIIRF